MKKYTTNNLSDPEVRHAKPQDRNYKLQDGGGLYCHILTTGTKSWRYRYYSKGKEKTYTIGNYPEIGLSEARTKRDKAKSKVKAGIDPSQQKQIEKKAITENTFQAVAETWLEGWKNTVVESTYIRTKRGLEVNVYPYLGSRNVADILAPEIIPIIKNMSDRDAVAYAKRIKGFMQQVFDFAVVHGKSPRNPVRDINLKLILPKTIKKHYAAIKDPLILGDLLRAIDSYRGHVSTVSALKLGFMVALRPSELIGGRWDEVDFDNSVWAVPARRRKLEKHLKEADREEDIHFIPLSTQAIEVLKELQKFTGLSELIFPSPKGNSRAMSRDTLRQALRGMGFDKETITPHGFRGTLSTFLNTLGYREDVIEAQLAHKDKNEIRSAYNHADYMEERKIMLQEWCDYQDTLREGATVSIEGL